MGGEINDNTIVFHSTQWITEIGGVVNKLKPYNFKNIYKSTMEKSLS